MKNSTPILWGMSLALACGIVTAAQDATSPDPKILQVTREFIKAGRTGAAHDRAESAFVQAMARAKSPTHYIALNSLTGKSRALYLTAFASFDAMEKDAKFVEKNAALSAEVDRASMSDGDLLDSLDQAVLVNMPEMGFHSKPQLGDSRYIEISDYVVKPGRGAEWRALVKMVQEAYEKAGTGAHWAVYELAYGGNGGTYLVFSSKKSLSEIDADFDGDKKFAEALGADGMKKLEELEQACIESSTHQLFSVNPRQSYVDEAWVKADPAFWKPKAATMAKTTATKPAAPAAAPSKPSSR